MKIKIKFILERPEIKKDYHSLFISFLKQSVENYNEDLYKKYYESENAQKKFTFAIYLGQDAQFKDDKIELDSTQITMNIRTSDIQEGFHLYNAFIKMQEENNFFPMNNNSMTILDIQMSTIQKVKRSKIVIQMMSPLIVREHHHDNKSTQFLTFEDQKFEDILKENIKANLENWRLNYSMNGFSIRPLQAKKTVAMAYGNYMNASLGTFLVTGSPILLEYLYSSGLSPSLNSSGFNMFEILKEG